MWQCWRRFVGPDLEGLGPGRRPVLIDSDVIAAEMEEVADRVVRREEPLHLPGRFEPLHLSLASSRRLMRILRPVVQSFVAAMLDTR
jgi:hypothetical protein